MSKRNPALAAIALLAALALTGCSKSTTAPGSSASLDVTQVNNTLTTSAALVDDNLAEDATQVPAAPAAEPTKGFATEATIVPFAWWQTVASETRTWSFAFGDTDSTTKRPTTCIATLSKQLHGSLVIVPRDPADTTIGSTTRFTKADDRTWVRRVRLQRLLIAGSPAWRVTGLTGAFVETASPTTHLVSLHVHSSSGVDTTIVDPTQFFGLRQVIAFTTQDTVTVTATTERSNDPVFLHRWDYRHRMHNNLDNTYSWTWVTSPWGGWRHFGVQAMTHGSIYDDTLPFDMQAWHLPFRVIGQQPAVDYYP